MTASLYHPLVTIVIPVYNGENYLSFAIDSALGQTYRPIEVLVISDGSTDGSDRIAESYGGRIRFLRKENGGVSSALNLAIRKMNGEWLSWLSHDDTYCPDKISAQMKQLGQLKQSGMDVEKIILCCNNDRIDAAGNPVRRKIKAGRQGKTPFETLILQMERYTIGGCNVIASRSAFKAMGGFNESNRTCSDAEMWYRLMLAGYPFLFSQDVLVHSRQHNQMVSATRAGLCQKELEELHRKTVSEVVKRLPGDREIRRLAEALDRRSLPRSADLAYSFLHSCGFGAKLLRRIGRVKNAAFSFEYRLARALYRAVFLKSRQS